MNEIKFKFPFCSLFLWVSMILSSLLLFASYIAEIKIQRTAPQSAYSIIISSGDVYYAALNTFKGAEVWRNPEWFCQLFRDHRADRSSAGTPVFRFAGIGIYVTRTTMEDITLVAIPIYYLIVFPFAILIYRFASRRRLRAHPILTKER